MTNIYLVAVNSLENIIFCDLAHHDGPKAAASISNWESKSKDMRATEQEEGGSLCPWDPVRSETEAQHGSVRVDRTLAPPGRTTRAENQKRVVKLRLNFGWAICKYSVDIVS